MGTIADLSEVLLELGLSASCSDEERAISDVALRRAEGAVKRFLGYDPVLKSRTEYYPRRDYNYGNAVHVWEATSSEAYVRRLAEGSTNELQVQHIPIREVPAIELRIDYDGRGGANPTAFSDANTLKVEGTDFWPSYDKHDSNGNGVCSDGIIRSVGLWPTTFGSVRIIYTAGYSNAELHGEDSIIDASPILEAVVEEAKRRAEQIFVRKKSTIGFVAGLKSTERLGDYSYSIDTALASKLYGNVKDLTDQSKMMLEEFVNRGWAFS